MQSPVIKRSVVIGGRKTSVSLEEAFWGTLKELAAAQKITISALVTHIDSQKQGGLSSALRVFVLHSYNSLATGPHNLIED